MKLYYPVQTKGRRKTTLAMVGQRYNSLTVISLGGPSLLVVRCDCGVTKELKPKEVRQYKTCGCGQYQGLRESRIKHGRAKTRTHNIWMKMRQRCADPTNEHYGGRGIKVCERWQASFEHFLADMGEAPDGLTIERIDNSKGYSPDNCRWATMREQSNNRRSNKPVTVQGVTKTRDEWAAEAGRHKSTIYRRIKRGLSPDQVVSAKRVPRAAT